MYRLSNGSRFALRNGVIAAAVVLGGLLTSPASAVEVCTAITTSGELLTLTLDTPLPGTIVTVGPPCCDVKVKVAGTAAVGLALFDFYFDIDSSGSTADCSGSDVDDDGDTGVPTGFGDCSDPGDSILAAEVKAIRDFVATLVPGSSRVAIVQFSNPEGFFGLGERQRIVQSLTADFAVVNAGLDEVLLGGTAGATDYGGGLDLIQTEFLATGDPLNRRQLAYFLSDGIPTFPVSPFNSEEPGDSQAAVDAADVLAANTIVINTFGIGFIPSVTKDPVLPKRCLVGVTEVSTLECVAARTGGVFFASNDPAEVVEQLALTLPELGIDSIDVRNATTGDATTASLSADGRWTADLFVQPNIINDIEVVALALDGTSCDVATFVQPLCVDAPLPLLPPLPPLSARSASSGFSPRSPCPPASPASPASPTSSPSSASSRSRSLAGSSWFDFGH